MFLPIKNSVVSINFSFCTVIGLAMHKARQWDFLSSCKLLFDIPISARVSGVISEDMVKVQRCIYALIESHILISSVQFRISSPELPLTPDEDYSQGEIFFFLYNLSQVGYYI